MISTTVTAAIGTTCYKIQFDSDGTIDVDNDNAGCATAFTSDATLSTYDSFTGGVGSFTGAFTGTVTIKTSPLVSTETLDLNTFDPGTKQFDIDLFYPTYP